jgi:hypothetical protein
MKVQTNILSECAPVRARYRQGAIVRDNNYQDGSKPKSSFLSRKFYNLRKIIKLGRVVQPSTKPAELLQEVYERVPAKKTKAHIGPAEHSILMDHQVNIPNKSTVNKVVRGVKTMKTYSKLYYYLRTKYFMKFRDPVVLQQLIADARTWMLKNGMNTEDAVHYAVFTSAVMTAFIVDREELEFRQLIKDSDNWKNMAHLNKTIRGDLGLNLIKRRERGLFKEATKGFMSKTSMPGVSNFTI